MFVLPEDQITFRSVCPKPTRTVEHPLVVRHAHDHPVGRAPDLLDRREHPAPHGLLDVGGSRSSDLIIVCLVVDLSL